MKVLKVMKLIRLKPELDILFITCNINAVGENKKHPTCSLDEMRTSHKFSQMIHLKLSKSHDILTHVIFKQTRLEKCVEQRYWRTIYFIYVFDSTKTTNNCQARLSNTHDESHCPFHPARHRWLDVWACHATSEDDADISQQSECPVSPQLHPKELSL